MSRGQNVETPLAGQLVESNGGKIDTILRTAGAYDIVIVTDFPDDETGTAIALQLAAGGTIAASPVEEA